MSLLLTIVGCAKTPTNVQKAAVQGRSPLTEVSAWQSIDEGNFRQRVAKVGVVPNIGLQLPVVSPDGRWVAALSAGNAEAIDPDALLSGRTIEAVSLVLFDLAHPQAPPRKVASGAAWPVWSHDSRTLYSVAYDKAGRCGFLVTDAATAKSRRLDVRIDHIISPSLSPSGNRLAFAAFNQVPQQAKLYCYQLDQQQLNPLAAPKNMLWQILPLWIDDHALIYYGRAGAETGLFGTSTGGASRNVRLAPMKLPPVAADAMQAQAGIVNPFSVVSNCLATFEAENQRLILTHLDDVKSTALDAGSQAGLWAGDQSGQWFIFSTGKELHLQTISGESRLLATQQLIPIWCSPGGSNLLALSPGQIPWTFDLLRLTFEPARSR